MYIDVTYILYVRRWLYICIHSQLYITIFYIMIVFIVSVRLNERGRVGDSDIKRIAYLIDAKTIQIGQFHVHFWTCSHEVLVIVRCYWFHNYNLLTFLILIVHLFIPDSVVSQYFTQYIFHLFCRRLGLWTYDYPNRPRLQNRLAGGSWFDRSPYNGRQIS